MRSFSPKCSIEGSPSIEVRRPKEMPGGGDAVPICVSERPASTTGPFPKGGCRPRCYPVWATSSPGPGAMADGSPSAASRSSGCASTPNCFRTRRSRASSTSKGSLLDGKCGPTCCSSTSIGVLTVARQMVLSRSITSDLALGAVPIASATWLSLAMSADRWSFRDRSHPTSLAGRFQSHQQPGSRLPSLQPNQREPDGSRIRPSRG